MSDMGTGVMEGTTLATRKIIGYKLGPLKFVFYPDGFVTVGKWDKDTPGGTTVTFYLTPEETEQARKDLREVINDRQPV